jgi:methylmalonyl-CoA mutase cobalamin-binding domain/chain
MSVLTEDQMIDLLERMIEGVHLFQKKKVAQAAQDALDWGADGADCYQLTMDGLAGGMELVSDKFDRHIYFVPETLLCAKALYAGLDLLKPHIEVPPDMSGTGKVILGVMQGDVHDLGKNLVKATFESAGFECYDLGKDVSAEKFLNTAAEVNPDIICLTALMTTSMVQMPKVIKKLNDLNPNIKIMIGGSPITGTHVDEWGADSSADNATNALAEALNILKGLRKTLGRESAEEILAKGKKSE